MCIRDSSKAIGRMTIDMPALLAGEKQSDVLLEDGDKLYIPTMQNVVSIAGMVQFPSSHIYKEETSINEYISLAGGTKKQADTDRVYVIKACLLYTSGANLAIAPGELMGITGATGAGKSCLCLLYTSLMGSDCMSH